MLPDIGYRYRVPISGTFPISGHTGTDIVNHIPDIGINIGINIGCPDIGDMLSRYRCQYRVPISGVPISGYDSHRCRSQYRTRYRITECAPVIAPHSLHIVPDRRSSQSPVAFRGGDPPIPVLQECANLCVSLSLEGLAPLDPEPSFPYGPLPMCSCVPKIRKRLSSGVSAGCLYKTCPFW